MTDRDRLARFGAELRRRRKSKSWTLEQLRLALSSAGDSTVTAAAISGWERGEYQPRRPETVWALERALGAEGELAPLLSLRSAPTTVNAEDVAALVRRLIDSCGSIDEAIEMASAVLVELREAQRRAGVGRRSLLDAEGEALLARARQEVQGREDDSRSSAG
jgi:transcriptional regulator with XRE-family HTH domain